jgi:hypothetical protein
MSYLLNTANDHIVPVSTIFIPYESDRNPS